MIFGTTKEIEVKQTRVWDVLRWLHLQRTQFECEPMTDQQTIFVLKDEGFAESLKDKYPHEIRVRQPSFIDTKLTDDLSLDVIEKETEIRSRSETTEAMNNAVCSANEIPEMSNRTG